MNNLNVKTSVDLVPETNLITFSVKAGTAAESYRVLQSVMENYNTVSDYAIKNVIIETIQQPSVAMAPINPLDEKRNCHEGICCGSRMPDRFIGRNFLHTRYH